MKLKDQSPMCAPLVLSESTDFDPKTASASFIISTVSQDRDGDVMKPEGCLDTLHTYQANPVVLFDHGEDIKIPIGMSETPDDHRCTIEVLPDKIKGRVFFHCETLESSQIARLTEKKVLRAASIGYKGIDADPVDPRRPRNGMVYNLWELVEWSIVPVPANQDALLQALGCKWEGKALADPIAHKFKSLLRPSKKLILPATVQSTRKKAMAEDTTNSTAEESSQLPAGAQGIQVLLAGISAGLSQVKEVYPTIEQPQVIKLLDKFIASTEKGMADLTKQAASIYPDIFEASDAVGLDPESGDDAEPNEDNGTGEEEDAMKGDVSAVDEEADDEAKGKRAKVKGKAYGEVDSSIHVATINDVTELLEDMSKSANIPSGYKRQCKGCLPGLGEMKSFFNKADKPNGTDCEEDGMKAEPPNGNDGTEEDADGPETEEKNAEILLKELQAISAKTAQNEATLKSLKRK